MVAEVNWEGCHHCDRWSSVHPNCRMVVAEKVSEQVVSMTAQRRWLPRLQVVSRRSIILRDYDYVTFWP
jgi:hypothetical protein